MSKAKEVYQYDLETGEYIKSFPSISELSRIKGYVNVKIIESIRKGWSYKGYKWSHTKRANYSEIKKSIDQDTLLIKRMSEDEKELIAKYREMKDVAYGKVHEEGENLTLTTNLSKSIDDIVDEFNIDLDLWEPKDFKPGAWTTPVKAKIKVENEDKDVITATIPIIIENRKSQVSFIKKTSIIDYDKFRRDLIEDIKRSSPKIARKSYSHIKEGNLLEITIPDLHLGKLAWGEETGDRNYDIKIAVDRFKEAVHYLLNKATQGNDFEQVLFTVGNDLFNSDNAYPYTQTTAGTPQQDDVRWQKVFRSGRNMIIDTIDILKEVAPVEVKIIPGNHDFQKSFYLGEVLEARFHGDKNVEIDNSPKTRKYKRWGNCLIGFTHGNGKDEGESRLSTLMQNEVPGDWSETLYREWHCGDIHHYKEVVKGSKPNKASAYKYAEDIDSVIIKYLRTLMFNDEWEARKGYRSQKGAHCFIWNKEEGCTTEFKFNM